MEISKSSKIEELFPEIFRRPVLTVPPDMKLSQAAIFMSIGPQIFVSGLVVASDAGRKVAGRISSRIIIEHFLKAGNISNGDVYVSKVMDSVTRTVELSEPVVNALEIFETSEFGFIPVTKDGDLIATLSLRDILPLVITLSFETGAESIASEMITIEGSKKIKEALELMLKHKVRNVIVSSHDPGINDRTEAQLDENNSGTIMNLNENAPGIFNDRMLLEYLSSHRGKSLIAREGIEKALAARLDSLLIERVKKVSADSTISAAANALVNVHTPCVIIKDKLLTPYDIVIKYFKSWINSRL